MTYYDLITYVDVVNTVTHIHTSAIYYNTSFFTSNQKIIIFILKYLDIFISFLFNNLLSYKQNYFYVTHVYWKHLQKKIYYDVSGPDNGGGRVRSLPEEALRPPLPIHVHLRHRNSHYDLHHLRSRIQMHRPSVRWRITSRELFGFESFLIFLRLNKIFC